MVHPCKMQTLHNYSKSSNLFSHWTLQYRHLHEQNPYTNEPHLLQNRCKDIMEACTYVLPLDEYVVDRICAWQIHPGNRAHLNPSIELKGFAPPVFGLDNKKIGRRHKGKDLSHDDPVNFQFRRKAALCVRSVLVLMPMELWGIDLPLHRDVVHLSGEIQQNQRSCVGVDPTVVRNYARAEWSAREQQARKRRMAAAGGAGRQSRDIDDGRSSSRRRKTVPGAESVSTSGRARTTAKKYSSGDWVT